LAGLWLATALLTGVQALNGQARASYALASGLVGGPPQWRLDAVDGRPLPQSAFVELRRQGWPVSPVLEGRARLAGSDRRLRVTGIDPISLPDDSRMAGESTSAGAVIDFISPPGEAWIAPQTLEELGLRAGAALGFSAPAGGAWIAPRTLEELGRGAGAPPLLDSGGRLPPLRPRGRMAPGTVLVDTGVAQRVLQSPGRLSRLLRPAGVEG